MDSNKIKAIIVVVLSLFVAIYLGITAATAQLETILWVVGGVGFVICLVLGRRIYLIIPLMTSLSLVLPIPGRFSSGLIAQGVVLAFATLLILMRRLPMRGGIKELEVWCLLVVLTVVQAYMRNPVGLNLFGADSIGAKPYFVFGLTTLSALLVSLLLIDPKDLKIWVRLSFVGSILNFTAGAIGFFVPQVGYYLGATFSSDLADQRTPNAGVATRIAFVRNISVALATWISSKVSPLRACFHPLWMPLLLLALAFAAISGYRSQLILVGLIFFLGICYRGGFRSVFASSILGFTSLLLLGFINAVAPLPLNIQRSLSFLPGTWDESIKKGGESSTEWRVEMWKEALLTDKWITNKWLGDGLGFTRAELEQMQIFQEKKFGNNTGTSGLTIGQESMMISGSYHSGPVQTIRTTGYIGLAILLLAMIRLAVHAHRQIKRCRNTEWYPVALFLGIPLVATPFFWTLVFGTFIDGTATFMMGFAIVRLMQKNLPLPALGDRNRISYIPDPNLPQPSPQQ